MSEGPQVRLKAEWLDRELGGREIIGAVSVRPELAGPAAELAGKRVRRVYWKGKHIFLAFEDGVTVHNRLLMRGVWRRSAGRFLFVPGDSWLTLDVGCFTVSNYHGQVLRLIDDTAVAAVMASLGPDVMGEPFPEDDVVQALGGSGLPIAEAVLDQGIVSGVGNVAKSEGLFLARADPREPARSMGESRLRALSQALRHVCEESYRSRGRWIHRVYQKAGQPCPSCGGPLAAIRQKPSGRATYFCVGCQGA